MNKISQEYIDFVENRYEVNDKLSEFHIAHLYPGELCVDEDENVTGYVDSRFFELVGFNVKSMQKRSFGSFHDEIRFGDIIRPDSDPKIFNIKIFADGSTMIKFDDAVKIETPYLQSLYIIRA